ncbi:MAG TPA: phospho-N-acetylmuramoyl-pentapeptide-transferase [Candidatus Tidjanibacter faecipullorum]|uniref:Phospho-N-acetylmuramoyl-pentapeptide-transferase n=1 Tax=Candidatus Tidjanibacter faecipullorum TaxID=2838766 RepID=A0A9D2ILJ3_9BACT|nr:phospho-N-acetylmuramoyl-pentapeptide-transferase [Candidatus Tidjanibacter faecipullorum]
MLYALLEYLEAHFNLPGTGLFQYLSFRSACAIIFALLIGAIFGKKIIERLRRHQIGEEIRNLGLEGQMEKRGTPTMGGMIILGAMLIPVVLFCDLGNVYVQLMIVSSVWLGLLGFADDYIKVFRKHKEGLKGKFKIVGQVGLGIIVGTTMCFSNDIVIVEKAHSQTAAAQQYAAPLPGTETPTTLLPQEGYEKDAPADSALGQLKTTKTTIPFVKNNEFDYHWLVPSHSAWGDALTWLIYVLVAIFIITAVSNGANLTDGLDGLATGVSAVIIVILGVFAYLSGNIIYSDYLNIMYIPGTGELMVFAAALVGALIGFLWYNCYPAQVFMGDTGSLALGGIIAVFALLVRKELLLPLLCGIFLVEAVSTMIQVSYFKYTKMRYGEGRRYFLMAPLHHHYQKKGIPENKIVVRFWIVQILLAALTLVTLKIR